VIVGIAIFFLLALGAAAVIVYPLLPGRTPASLPAALSDADIERAVESARKKHRDSGLGCPSCGQAYEAGDRFCVRCGYELPQAVATSEAVCPSCGAAIRGEDRFCAKCGHTLAVEEAA
jgi:predicted amidophosphoribosyltransferase